MDDEGCEGIGLAHYAPQKLRDAAKITQPVLVRLGIEVKEVCGVSDHEYAFIGARDPSGDVTWLFCGDGLVEFMNKAELFLKGVRCQTKPS